MNVTSSPLDLPLCPHFGPCGGCKVQDLPSKEYLPYKLNKILAPLYQQNIDLKHTNIHPVKNVSPHTRRRAVLKAFRTSKSILLGFYQRESHQIVDIKRCLIVVPKIEALFIPLRNFLRHLLLPQMKAEIFLLKCDQGLDIEIDCKALLNLSLEQRELSAEFATHQGLIRLVINQEPIFSQTNPTISFDGMAVAVSPKTFLQASFESDQWLAQKVCEAVSPGIQYIADLFCGRGTFTLPLSRLANVDGYEMDKEAIDDLKKATSLYKRPIRSFIRQLFKEPLTELELKSYDMVVINPPREGAHRQIQHLSQTNMKKIVYVSCNPKTFARDAKTLTEAGFSLREIYPFDQFLWSDHMEIVSIFYCA